MTHNTTFSTTSATRRQPQEANTFGVFAGVPPIFAEGCFTSFWRAGHPTQFEERVASLINLPLRRRGGLSQRDFAHRVLRRDLHRTAAKGVSRHCVSVTSPNFRPSHHQGGS